MLLLVGRRPVWGFETLVVAGLAPGFPVRLRPGCDELFLMMDIHQMEAAMTPHARPDVPQPDPVVHDKPGDLPQVPCPDDLDDYKPGTPFGGQAVADEAPEPT